MVRVKDILDGFEGKVVLKCKEISLAFEGYYDETNLARFDGKIGVYCAYATNADGKLSDLVYIGRSGDNIKNRVVAHQDKNDEARSTLKKGEHLAYAFAETNEHELCEKVLIAKHRDSPRLANTKLKKPYEGNAVHLRLSGKCRGLETDIQYEGPEKGA